MNLLTLVLRTLEKSREHDRAYTIYRLLPGYRASPDRESFIVRKSSEPAPSGEVAEPVMNVYPTSPFNPTGEDPRGDAPLGADGTEP